MPRMTLRLKLILSFLLIGVLSAGAVGGTAWWMLMRNFQSAYEERAFANFRSDIEAYVRKFGSWEAGQRQQAFPEFATARRGFSGAGNSPSFRGPPGEQAGQPPRPPINVPGGRVGDPPGKSAPAQPPPSQRPPFRFTLIDPQGRVIQAVEKRWLGRMASERELRRAHEIRVDGRLVFYALPEGSPVLSNDERVYLDWMRQALFIGLCVAVVGATLFGVLFGNRLVASLNQLMDALRALKPGGELPEMLTVRSRDEIGLLAETYNHMSRLLDEAHRELREQNIRDHLTDLYNRRYFDEQARSMYAHTRRHKRPLCVMMTDVDHFKKINDGYSHAVGDRVLQRVARLLHDNIRSSDIVARFGGEEFAAVFPESSLEQAREHCEALRRLVATEPWDAIAPGLVVTISIGLSDRIELGSFDAVLEDADTQLYKAKENGRNRIEPASSERAAVW